MNSFTLLTYLRTMTLDREIADAIKQSQPTIQKPTCPLKHGWSDKECEELSKKMVFPIECLQASTQRAIIIRYINFYSAGVTAPGMIPFDIISAMLAIFPSENCVSAKDTIWPESYFGSTNTLFDLIPQYSVGEESVQAGPSRDNELEIVMHPGQLTKLETDVGVTLGELPGGQNEAQSTETSNPLIYNYTSAISQSFLDTIRKTVGSTEATAAQGKAMIVIRRVLGYTALTLVRAIIKDPIQLANAFSKAQYRRNLIALLSLAEVVFCPPCNKALTIAVDAFNKQLSKPVYLLSMIVNHWRELTNAKEKKMAAMLGASCLTHTSYNGMAMIHLLVEVLHHFNVEWSDLCMLLYMDVTKESWRRIAQFMKTYQHKDGPQFTQPWARVIDDGYLMDLSGQENFALCAILAASIDETVDGVGGVWDSFWASTRQAEISEMRKLGYALRSYFTKKLKDVKPLTEESQKLLAHAQNIQPATPTAPPRGPSPMFLNRSDV